MDHANGELELVLKKKMKARKCYDSEIRQLIKNPDCKFDGWSWAKSLDLICSSYRKFPRQTQTWKLCYSDKLNVQDH